MLDWQSFTEKLSQVFIPVLTYPGDDVQWPEVVVEDVKKHVYQLRNVICQVIGVIFVSPCIHLVRKVCKEFQFQRCS